MNEKYITKPTMWCRYCGYPLNGLSEDRCPECGRTFESADPRTFRRSPIPPYAIWRRIAAWASWRGLSVYVFAMILFFMAISASVCFRT